jgi:hypothetical protein
VTCNTSLAGHVPKLTSEVDLRGRDDLFKLTGQKPMSMYDFVKLHAAEFTRPEIVNNNKRSPRNFA